MNDSAKLASILALFYASVALAATVEPLPFVSPPPLSQYHQPQSHCAATGFNPDGSISGTCQYFYGQSAKYFALPSVLYTVSWDASLNPTLGSQCGATDIHRVATGCRLIFNPTGSTVVINGVPYYYVSAGSAGELVSSNVESFLVQ